MRILPPVYFLLSLVVMAALHLLLPIVRWIPGPWNGIGALPLSGGVLLAVMANRLFHRRGTPVHPFGEASMLVVDGPFRYTRNPMYLGLILTLIGIAVLLGTLSPWIVIPPFAWILARLFVRREERVLQEKFGQEFLAYKQKVRRWI